MSKMWPWLLGCGMLALVAMVLCRGLPVYAFSGTAYTNYNGTTNASGRMTLTLPSGSQL